MKAIGIKRSILFLGLSVIMLIVTIYELDNLINLIKTNKALSYQNKKIEQSNHRDYKIKAKLSQEVITKQSEIDRLSFELYKNNLKDHILLKYKKWGSLQEYTWITPNHIKNVIDYCFKYYPIVNGERIVDKVDLPIIMIAICYQESNFNPTYVYDKNTDSTKDYGITQINTQCLFYCESKLPEHLKVREIKRDTEANICGRFHWIKQRRSWNMEWLGNRFGNRGWEFYGGLKNVK